MPILFPGLSMFLWLAFVDVIRAALLMLSHAAGGNAARAGRFLWVADLARPEVFITALAATTASLAPLLAPANNASNKGMAVITTVVTVMIVWRLAAGVGLYWVGSSAVGVRQSLIVRQLASRQ